MSSIIAVTEIEPGITNIRLTQPDSLNAMTMEMVSELRAAFTRLASDTSCRVILLNAEGRAFCAGLNLKEALPKDARPMPIERMVLQEHYAGLMTLARSLPQPIVAAVNGVAAGAGMGLSLASDIRWASPSAKFLIGAVKIGLTAAECGISYHLPRLVGAGRAADIMLTGRVVLAEEALRIGLVTGLSDSEEDLFAKALETARQVAANSPYAVKHTKQVFWKNIDAQSFEAAIELENHVQTVAMLTDDFAEAIAAFNAKRPPEFKGR